MQPVVSQRGRWACVALMLGAAGISGCGRTGPAAAKALASGERSGARTVGRSAMKSEQAATKEGWKKKKAGEFVGDRANDAYKDWAKNQGRQDEPGPVRFRDPSAVRPLAGTRPALDASTGLYGQPNDYGGVSFYHADGRPAGFSVLHRPTGRFHVFDPSGSRVR